MKTLILIAIFVGSMITGCTNMKEKTANELLNDPKTEIEIYSAILADNVHLSKFMDKMLADENCNSLMAKNDVFVKMVCKSEKMDSMISHDKETMGRMMNNMVKKMEGDSTLCDRTCTMMMENERIRNYFKEHLDKTNGMKKLKPAK